MAVADRICGAEFISIGIYRLVSDDGGSPPGRCEAVGLSDFHIFKRSFTSDGDLRVAIFVFYVRIGFIVFIPAVL